MKKLFYFIPVALMLYACGGAVGGAGDKVLASADDSLCYAIGAITANNFKDQGLNLNSEQLRAGFDAGAADNGYLTDDEMAKIFTAFSMEMRMKQMDPTKKDAPFTSVNIDTLSYAMGLDIFNNVKDSGVNMSSDAFYAGNADAYKEAAAKLNDDQIKSIMDGFNAKMQAIANEKAAAAAAENKVKGAAFLAGKEKEEGVQKTASGLLYKVVKAGKGKKPVATSKVKVHYHGTLIDGTVFDSSVDRGEPIEFPLNGVIRGWTEGVQLMSPGAKYTFYIPSDLAYGNRGQGPKIGPGAALVFDVELIEIVE